MSEHTVKQGDCLLSIGKKYGLAWKKIWEHPNNAELKNKRKNPGTLYPGDVLYIPEKNEKLVVRSSVRSGKRHRFQPQTGVQPAILRLQIVTNGEPCANKEYILEIANEQFSGTMDADGKLEHSIPHNVEEGRLLLGEFQKEYLLNIGHLDPIGEVAGTQARLNNLGFNCGKVDGVPGTSTKEAIKMFQKEFDLSITGDINDAQTKKKLENVHDKSSSENTSSDAQDMIYQNSIEQQSRNVMRCTDEDDFLNTIDILEEFPFSV